MTCSLGTASTIAASLPLTSNLDQYLVVGTGSGEAFLMSNVEIGADQEVVSSSDISDNQRVGGPTLGFSGFSTGGLSTGSTPSLESIFFPGDVRNDPNESIYVPEQNTNGTTGTDQVNNRWNDIDPSAGSNQDVVGTPDTLGIAGDGLADARPLFEGIDWSGNVAITNESGTFNSSNSDVNANLGIQCAQSVAGCFPSPSDNNAYFADQLNIPVELGLDGGVSGLLDPTDLLIEIAALRDFIYDPLLIKELTITSSIVGESFKDGGTPFITDLDAIDTNNDGIAVIDINVGDNAFSVTDSDWILATDKGTLAIFRLIGGTSYDFENSSIMMGGLDWDLETNPLGLEGDVIDEIGAIFAINEYRGENVVFDGDNVILGGIGLYDFIDISGYGSTFTEIDYDNAQGCAQFISNQVDFQNTRWNRCALSSQAPEPSSLTLMGLGIAVLAFLTRRRRVL